MIEFTCSACGKRYTVPDAAAGRKAKCGCGEVLIVPAPAVATLTPDVNQLIAAKIPMRARRLIADAKQMTAAFANFPLIRIHSTTGDPPESYQIDYQVNSLDRQPLGAFTLFNFSAKIDPVATMLVQDHRQVIADFYGLTTSFRRSVLKPGVTVLGDELGAPWVKYIHGEHGKGTWTFFGGHDPEDPQHAIGDAPTDLSLHPHSPGYRLILNNVLFPAAKKKELKT